MGRRRKGLKIDGVLLLDKPVGLSSNSALQKARRLLNAQKAGHTGTLDPLASGLLPLCFGEATKFSADLLHADKEYLTTVKFGEKTSTGDSEGEVIFSAEPKFTFKEFCAVLDRFRGEIIQIPPMYSALKKDGVPLYKLARKGEEIEREPRKVVISSLDIVDFQPPEVTLLVRCSKGTYIRTLGEDIGEALGCGAHLKTLRRTAVADLHIEEAVDLELFEQMTEEQRIAVLLPPDRLLQSLAPVELDEEATKKFLNGMKVRTDERSTEGAKVRVYGASAEKTEFLLGVGRLTSDGVLAPDRLISFVDNDR
ncbi:tRNA pseudouridine(55) synthase TruB [Parasutterella excrementihominis]|uniref:tRNA pseudouridine(55) synthase TruB n=1 Tax=Parasutterella excrementihominis TaxID=487175 RepID=UPI003AAD5671